MRKLICLAYFLSVFLTTVLAADFETATQAVANMKVGWNLGNTLDAYSQSTNDPSSATYWGRQGLDSETYWGQPKTSSALMKMFADAGFGTIRVPVTWFNHMDKNGKVNPTWMARVKEVVDYVIANGMYCVLNVHHDTGADGDNFKSWIKADVTNYNNNKQRFEYLWQQIAETFKDYDEHLIFESYNEMLDTYNSWCYASFSTSSRYDASVAASAYQAINSYAQSFVTTVRNSGGNNAQRNLVVNVYAAASGYGTWSTHLQDPFKEMKLPTDNVQNHLIFEIHSYPNIANRTMSDINNEIDGTITNLKNYLVKKGAPVIVGEWGTSNVDASDGGDYANRRELMAQFAKSFVRKFKAAGMGTIYWMGLSDATDRSILKWSQPEIKNAILKGWYGDDYEIPADPDPQELVYTVNYTGQQWAELNLYSGSTLLTSNYKGIRIELGEVPPSGNLQFKVYGADDNKGQYEQITEASQTLIFEASELGNQVRRVTLQYQKAGSYSIKVKGAWLIKKDGTEEKTDLSSFWGCTLSAEIVTAIQSVNSNRMPTDNAIYNLQGQRIQEPLPGQLYVKNGKKYRK